MKWIGLLVFLLGINLAQARPAQIIIIRHAEEPGGAAIDLSPTGWRHARALAFFFSTNAIVTRYGPPAALFAPHPSPGRSRRSEETLIPTSRRLHVPIQGTYSQNQYVALARMLLEDHSYRGKTVVIAWTHEFIPQMAAALGVRPTPPPWNPNKFDRFYVIRYGNTGVTFRDLPQQIKY